jgi:hypothetical protein
MLQQLDTLIGFAVVMSVASLLITISTQTISSVLGLRGSNLADGLEAMLQKIVPTLDPKVRGELVERILTQPVISDSMLSMSDNIWDKIPLLAWFRKRWKRASAIRPEEFLEVLKDLAETVPEPAGARLAARQPAATTAQAPETAAPDQAPPAPLKIAALQVLSALHVTAPATAATIAALPAQLPGLTQPDPAQINARFDDPAGTAGDNLENWFNSAQDRAQQWFAMHARIWTVTASVVLAFLLQLDTFRLITKLSSDPNERAKLIQFSQATLQQKADEVFTNNLSASTIYRQAIDRLETATNIAGLGTIGKPQGGVNFHSQPEAESWLAQQVQAGQANPAEILTAYRKAVQDVAKENYNKAGAEFSSLNDAFAQTGVQLMANPYPPVFTSGWKLWSWPWEWRWSGVWSWPASHLFGILTSAALLSLGAPFWFNTLKSLANLRPLLADQIGQEQKSKRTAGGQ